jgi:hypothetical protein
MRMPNDNAETIAAKKPTLSELLQRSLEEDAVIEEPSDERERWDDDEGAFGG